MEEYINDVDKDSISMQTLAFIGDAVHNLYIRMYLASKSNIKTGKLHVESIGYVSARSQSHVIDEIYDMLTEQEQSVYKRGRNTNINTVSKNVDVVSYKKSTGFESLLGYLYITKQTKRLEEIIKLCIEKKDKI